MDVANDRSTVDPLDQTGLGEVGEVVPNGDLRDPEDVAQIRDTHELTLADHRCDPVPPQLGGDALLHHTRLRLLSISCQSLLYSNTTESFAVDPTPANVGGRVIGQR